jgi:glycosyltransferase involved in cell wall biosynthesis
VHVCFFNRSYWPDTGATGQLLTELAEDLVARHGWEVTVITGMPLRAGTVPATQLRNGVRIIRASGTTFDPKRFAGRAVNYLTYFATAFTAGVKVRSCDVCVGMTDPPIIGLAALAASRRSGGKFVFVSQDVFPEVAALLEDFQSPLVNRALDRLNRYFLRAADRVVVLGDSMKRRLVDGKGADPQRMTVIHNWADSSQLQPADTNNGFARRHGLAGYFVVMHAGNIGQSQNLDVVLDAAELLRDDDRIRIVFVGDGTRRSALEARASGRGLKNVVFIPYQPRDEMSRSYAAAGVFLVSLRPGLSGFIVPSKVYSILAAGKPFIAAIEEGSEAVSIAREHGCGVVVPTSDAGALAEAIRTLADNPAQVAAMGRRALIASELFDRSRQVSVYARVLSEVASA